MPVPFRDADEVDELGAAGFLKIDSSVNSGMIRGALLLINARGEPLEFTYNRIETPNSFLWRQDDIRRFAVRKLVTSLLGTCSKVPQLIVCLADEVHHELFSKEILLSMPVCRIASFDKAVSHSKLEVEDSVGEPRQMHVFWFPGKPPDQSREQRLLDRLFSGGLLVEPFDRALIGLREVYPSEAARD